MKDRHSGSAIGLVALTAVVAALVGFAMRTPAALDETVEHGPGQTAVTRSATSSSQPSSARPSPSDTRIAEPASESVLLSVTTKTGGAVRALAGDCKSGGAMLELSDDGGKTWRDVEIPARGLLRVKAVSAADAWVVGTDKDCKPRFIRTTDGGTTWVTKVSTVGAWHLLPAPSTRLHAPKGNVDSPCAASTPAVDLAVSSNTAAAILCTGGQVHTTQDAGTTWQRAGSSRGATALAFLGRRAGFASTPGNESCAGTLASRSSDSGTTWQERGCAEGATGGVAMAFSSNTVGLMATVDEVWQTDDAGSTWTRL